MEDLKPYFLLIHILAAVFLAGPFYVLMAVNERALLSDKPFIWADRLLENYIRRHLSRCCVYNWTALISGVFLATIGIGISGLIASWFIPLKILILLSNMLMRAYARHMIQPKIDEQLALVDGELITPDIGQAIRPHRVLRKKLSIICFFNVMLLVILGVQIATGFSVMMLPLLIAGAMLLSWRVYSKPMSYGWF